MRTLAFVSLACLLAGCAMPPPKPAVVSANDKPACDLPETGSHMVDRHSNCNRSNVQVMGADATATALRQANPGSILSH
jgi:outer membrane PBP1 activator LpoA protein